jgi:hypothetical protein
MQGLRIINGGGATFGPGEMKVITTAYNEAWSEIASHYNRKGMTAEGARTRLAIAILQAASVNARDREYLKSAGLRAMQYRV